jgi:GTP cyclohydrolase I
MNIHPEDMTPAPDRDDAAEALRTLRQWAATASNAEIGALDPAIGRLQMTIPKTSSSVRTIARRCRTCRTARPA